MFDSEGQEFGAPEVSLFFVNRSVAKRKNTGVPQTSMIPGSPEFNWLGYQDFLGCAPYSTG
jgi:hypothetical protein